MIVLCVENIIRIYVLCRHALLFEDMGGEFNIPLAAKAKSVREFDEGLTRGRCFFHMKGIFSVFFSWGWGIVIVMLAIILVLSTTPCSFVWFQVSG